MDDIHEDTPKQSADHRLRASGWTPYVTRSGRPNGFWTRPRHNGYQTLSEADALAMVDAEEGNNILGSSLNP